MGMNELKLIKAIRQEPDGEPPTIRYCCMIATGRVASWSGWWTKKELVTNSDKLTISYTPEEACSTAALWNGKEDPTRDEWSFSVVSVVII